MNEENRRLNDLLDEARKVIDETKAKANSWWERNKEKVITYGPFVVAGLATLTKVVGKHANLAEERKLKDLRCYDTSLGHYWQLRRKLTNDDWLQINMRRSMGESLGDILEDMHALK